MSTRSGVYVLQGPAGVYVGESQDCFVRNRQMTRLGLDWGMVVEMPGSTGAERREMEAVVARRWAARGLTVISGSEVAGYSTAYQITAEGSERQSAGARRGVAVRVAKQTRKFRS